MEQIEKMQIFGDIYYKLDNIVRIVDNFNSNLISQIPDRQKELHRLTLDIKDLVDKIVYETFNLKKNRSE